VADGEPGLRAGDVARSGGPAIGLALLFAGGRDLASQGSLQAHAQLLWGDAEPATIHERLTAPELDAADPLHARVELDRLIALRLAQAGDQRDLADAIRALTDHPDRFIARAARETLAEWELAPPPEPVEYLPLEELLDRHPGDAVAIAVIDGRIPLDWQDPGALHQRLGMIGVLQALTRNRGNVDPAMLVDDLLGTLAAGELPIALAWRHGNLAIHRVIASLRLDPEGHPQWHLTVEGDFSAEQMRGLLGELDPALLELAGDDIRDRHLELGTVPPLGADVPDARSAFGEVLGPATQEDRGAFDHRVAMVHLRRPEPEALPLPPLVAGLRTANLSLWSDHRGTRLAVEAHIDDPEAVQALVDLLARPLPLPDPGPREAGAVPFAFGLHDVFTWPAVVAPIWAERAWERRDDRLTLELAWPEGRPGALLRALLDWRQVTPVDAFIDRERPALSLLRLLRK